MGRTRKSRRVWALLMTVVMVLSLIVTGKAPEVKAALQGYTVNIHFTGNDRTTPINPDSPAIEGNYYVVVEATAPWYGTTITTWAIKEVNFNSSSPTTTVNIEAYDFRVDSVYGGSDNNNYQGYFNPDWGYNISSVRLWKAQDGVYLNTADNGKTLAQQKSYLESDAAPTGYSYQAGSSTNSSADVNLYRTAFDAKYELRVKFDGAGSALEDGDHYFAVVEVEHATSANTYFITPITTDGSGETITYPVTTWLDNNGNEKTNEKFTGNETGRNVYLYRLKDGKDVPANAEFINKGEMFLPVASGVTVKSYTYDGKTSGKDTDDEAFVETQYDELHFSAITTDSTYNYLSVLQNAVNYGVTANFIEVKGHSQTNMAANKYKASTNIDSNLSGPLDTTLNDKFSGSAAGVFLLGEIDGQLIIGNQTYGNPVVITSADPLSDYVVDDTVTHDKVIAVNTDLDTIQSSINGMIADMVAVSNDMSSHSATVTPLEAGDGTVQIDSTGFPDDATIYVDADSITDAIENGKVKIKKNKDQVIVFNFKTTTHLSNIGVLTVDYGEGEKDTNTVWGDANDPQNDIADQIARQVVWNLASVTELDGTTRAGGMFLLSNPASEAHFGGASCGWIVSAGDVYLGESGEFHFVYRDLNPNSQAKLSLRKTVEGKAPAASETFTFTLERLNSATGEFETIKTNDSEGNIIDYVVKNNGAAISVPLTELNDGQNVIRIKEKAASGYKANTQEFYAVFDVKVITAGTATIKIPGAVSYYSAFDAATGETSQKVTTTPTFKNEKADDLGYINITKTIKGDVTEEDLTGLTFTVKNGDKVIGEYTLGTDFELVDGKYQLKTPIEAEAGDGFTVIETLTTMDGFTVVVTNKIGDGDAVTGSETDAFAVTKDKTTEVAFEDNYTLKDITTDIEASKQFRDETGAPRDFAAGAFSFTLTGSQQASGTNKTVSVESDGSVSFGTLNYSAPGTYVYTIRENAGRDENVSYDETVYVVTVKVVRNTDGTGLSLTKTVTKDGVAYDGDIEFVNEYSTPVEKGYINITKTITGPVTADDLANMTFTVKKGTETVATFKLGEDFDEVSEGKYQLKADKVLEAVAGEDYTVTESVYDAEGNSCEVSYKIGSTSGTGDETDAFAVTKGETTNVDFTNDYTAIVNKGYINLTKTIKGDVTDEDLTGLTFTVKKGTETVATFKLGEDFDEVSEGKYQLKADKVLEVEAGEDYTVTETLHTLEGFTVEVSYQVNDEASKTGEEAAFAVEKDATTVVAFENDYTKETVAEGGLTVVVYDEETGEPVPDTTITVKKGDDTFTGKTDKEGRVTFNPIPTGEYTITITDVPDGYTVTTGDGGKETVVENDIVEHEIRIIPKEEEETPEEGGLTVVVYDEETGEPVPDTTITVKKGDDTFTGKTDKEGRVTFNPIPTGEYTITITDVPEGYTVTTGDGGKETVVVNEIKQHEIKIIPKKETSEEPNGGMTIVVIDEVTGDVVPNAVLEITHNKDKTIKFTKTTDEKGRVTLNPIPTGDYTVVVTKVPDGYTVSKNKEQICTVVNNRISSYEVKIHTAKSTSTQTETPKTGDNTPVRMFLLLMLISAGGALALFQVKRKRKDLF